MSAPLNPMSYAVLRPRCWSGKNRTLSPRASAQSRIARAFELVHTAPHDVGRLVVVCREPCQLERVAALVRPLDHLGPLVVVPEDEQLRAELGFCVGDPRVDLFG